MKIILFSAIIVLALACGGGAQNDAKNLAGAIQETREAFSPGMVEVSQDGYMLKAKFNGRQWEAQALYPPKIASRIAGESNHKGKESISLPYEQHGYHEGQVINLGESKNADLFINDDTGIYGAHEGQIVISKVTDKWVEGNFNLKATTVSDPSKIVLVTDGFFRIPTAGE